MNDFFNHNSPLTKHTLARASQVNAIFQSIVAGLDKLPDADPLNQGRVTYVADTGAADAYVVSLAKAPSAYTAGLSIVMKATNTNTGASTINVNSLGVKTIKRYNGDDLVANDIVAGALIHLAYDGTNFRVVGANGAESALAKEWATSTSVVSGGLKGARGYAQDASSSASAAATSETNAEAQFNAFQGIFYGALSSDPATDPNGDPPDEGDWYYNTSAKIPRIFDGSIWKDIGAARLSTFVFTASGGETSLSGADDNGNTLAYTVDFILLHKNGALLTPDDDYTADDGTSITGLSSATAGDVFVIDAFATLSLSDVLSSSDLSDNEILGKKGSADPTGLTPKEVFTLLVYSAAGTNHYSADLAGDVSTGEWFLVDIANANDAVAPIFENTGGLPAGARRVRITENGDNWVQVGNSLAVSTASLPALTALDVTDVAAVVDTTLLMELRTYRFDGTDWSQVGNKLTVSSTGGSLPTLAALNETDVAYIDGAQNELRTYRFDGTDWSQVGNSLAVSAGGPTLAALNGTDVAFIEGNNDELRTYRFDGTDWSQVGNSLSITSVTGPTLAALNETDVAFIDHSNDDLRIYRFDGTDWAQVGNDLNIPVNEPTLAALNETDVALIDDFNGELRTYRFDGTDWTEVGNALAVSGTSYPALAALNGSDVAFIDDGNEQLRTYTLNEVPKDALSGPHTFELASDGTWLVLDPSPVSADSANAPVARDSDGRAQFADPSAAQDAATKSYVDSGDPDLETAVDATNGGSDDLPEIDFTTIKSGANRITILVESLSLTGTDQVLVQIGDSGGFETSGYTSLSAALASGSTNVVTGTSGFVVRLGSASVVIAGGEIVLTRISGNKWVCAHNLSRSDSDVALTGSGVKELSAELDRVRIASSGSDTFDGGNVNILVE